MLTFTDAQLQAWIAPLLWPFLRALALFTSLPVIGQRIVPVRVRIALAFFIAVASQATLPAMPAVALDSPAALLLAAQQVMIGLALGFAVRLVFAAAEMAGEVVGLQMGLNYASFFDPATASQTNAAGRLFGAMVALLFIVVDGHLAVIAALVRSFDAFPVSTDTLGWLRTLQPHAWGAEVFQLGLWIALPLVGMLLFVNIVLGVISRVAPQINVFAVGFPLTLSVGLVGMLVTLPMMQSPFTMALERMLAQFR
ncbi:MAG: flagellar biosynthetic protein FliR [Ideonella sp.]|nr:flagellar biosynthetic protein FliR [Ideonella sp.]MCC7455362.1 flagellar biosynthetic protein FliR [Nitrospira sp.]